MAVEESLAPVCAFRELTLATVMSDAAGEEGPAAGTVKRCAVAGCAGSAVVATSVESGTAVELQGDCANASDTAQHDQTTQVMLAMLAEMRSTPTSPEQ